MKVVSLQKTLLIFLVLGAWSPVANAIGGRRSLAPVSDQLDFEAGSRRKLNDHVFGRSKNTTAPSGFGSFDLFKAGTVSLDSVVRNKLRNLNLHPSIQLRNQNKKRAFNLQWAGIEQSKYKMYYDNIEICGFEVSAQVFNNSSTWFHGEVPVVSGSRYTENDWPSFELSLDQVLLEGSQWGLDISTYGSIHSEKCWRIEKQELIPAWRISLKFGDKLPYQFMADADKVYAKKPLYFDASGTIRGFEKNSEHAATIDRVITDFTGEQKLRTPYFTSDPQGQTAVQKNDYSFIYTPGTDEFDEATAFLALHDQFEFMKDIGYEWVGSKPMTLQINKVFQDGPVDDDVNNARYIPEYMGQKPFIQAGTGDGVNLQNLTTDRDVIAHEFGHHVVYRSLTEIGGESGVLHEALADYWAFTKTNDACLGESVCPNGTGFCWVPNQCLRSGTTNLKITDNALKYEGIHIVGQVVSGMLWDLRVKDSVPTDVVDSLVHNAIDLLKSNSGFRDLIIALLFADQSFHNSTYGAKIYLRAVARGFGSEISDIHCPSIDDCDLNELPTLTGATVTPTVKKSTRSKSSGGCGVIQHLSKDSSQTPWGFLFVLLVPIFIVGSSLIPRPAPVRIRRKP